MLKIRKYAPQSPAKLNLEQHISHRLAYCYRYQLISQKQNLHLQNIFNTFINFNTNFNQLNKVHFAD